jgi:hypothetical protein
MFSHLVSSKKKKKKKKGKEKRKEIQLLLSRNNTHDFVIIFPLRSLCLSESNNSPLSLAEEKSLWQETHRHRHMTIHKGQGAEASLLLGERLQVKQRGHETTGVREEWLFVVQKFLVGT